MILRVQAFKTSILPGLPSVNWAGSNRKSRICALGTFRLSERNVICGSMRFRKALFLFYGLAKLEA